MSPLSLTSRFLHFFNHWRPGDNPAARLTWGVEPFSPRRRRRARLDAFGPAGVGLALWLLAALVLWRMGRLGDPTAAALTFYAISVPLLLFLPLGRPLHNIPRLLHPATRAELRLTSLRGADLLRGCAHPTVCGALLLAALYVLQHLVFIGWFAVLAHHHQNQDAIFPVSIFAAMYFLIGLVPPMFHVCASLFEVSLWAWSASSFRRMIWLLAFYAGCLVCAMIIPLGGLLSPLIVATVLWSQALSALDRSE